MSDIFGFRQWQFEQNDNNFWRQATPALREQLNPSAKSPKLRAAEAQMARDNLAQTEQVCGRLSRAHTPDARAAAYEAYKDQVRHDARELTKKYGVRVEQHGRFATLPEIEAVCDRRAGVNLRRH